MSLVCPTCGKSFSKSSGLYRHIRNIHEFPEEKHAERKMSVICPTCGKSFSQTSACDRHIKSVHENPDGLQFKCSVCNKGFKRRDNLTVHINVVHLGKLGPMAKQKCPWPLCNYYCAKSNLKPHMQKIHIDDREPGHVCSICSLSYFTVRALMSHKRRDHGMIEKKEKKDQSCKKSCPLCNFTSVGHHCIVKPILLNHYTKEHDIKLQWEKLTFDNLDEFYDWKEKIENETSSLFQTTYNGDLTKEKKDSKLARTYICNRSGYTRSKVKTEKRCKRRSSVKINAFCPAMMKVREGINKIIEVSFLNVHLGHNVPPTEDEAELLCNIVSLSDDGEDNLPNTERKSPTLAKMSKSQIASNVGSDHSEIKRIKNTKQSLNQGVVYDNTSNSSNFEGNTPDNMIIDEEVEVDCVLNEESTSGKVSVPDINLSKVKKIVPGTVKGIELTVTKEENVVSDLPTLNELKSKEEQVYNGAGIAVEMASNISIANILQEINQLANQGNLQMIQLTVPGLEGVSKNTKYLYIKQDNKLFSKFEEVSSSVVVKINER